MEKSLDSHGRWRKKIVAFRVSEEEARIIDDRVALKNRLNDVYEELKRITGVGEVDDVLLEVIELIGATMNGMKEDKNNE